MSWAEWKRKLVLLPRWVQSLWSGQVRELGCLSVRGRHCLQLPGQLLTSAEQARISLEVLWPMGAWGAARGVQVQLVGWGSEPSRYGCPTAQTLEAAAWKVDQSSTGRRTQLQVQVRLGALAGCSALELVIREARRGRVLRHCRLELLEEGQAQQLRLATLRAQDLRLWIQSAACRHCGELVADSSDFLLPEFTVIPSELSALLPENSFSVKWFLLAEHKQACVATQSVRLGGQPLTIQACPVSLKNRAWFPAPGAYRLVATLADREIAQFPFRLLSYQEWLQHIQIERIDLAAETLSGEATLERAALHWGRHSAFQPLVRFTTRVPAQNTLLQCSARLTCGETLLREEHFELRLGQPVQAVALSRFKLSELDGSREGKHIRLNLALHLNGEPKLTWPIIILPAAQVTNFEGQLTGDPADLPLDEEAYQSILAELTAKPSPQHRPSS